MNQQRQRRFRSALEAQKLREKKTKKGEVVPDADGSFDSNAITPGTEFMAQLSNHLRYFIQKKINEDVRWQQCKVIFSGHDVQYFETNIQGTWRRRAQNYGVYSW